MLVCTPVPTADALDADLMNAAIERALQSAAQQGITGPGVTPVVLAAIAADTSGEAVRANLALAENNARLAAALAVSMTQHS
jgi:pseudouridine-5'-phosphate glycosidase